MPRLSPQYSPLVKIGPNRVEKVYLGYAAEVLRQHSTRKQVLRELEAQVIQATPVDDNRGMPRASGVSNPTPAAAERLDDQKEPSFQARAHIRMLIRTVEDVLPKLPAAHRAIINEVYMRRERTILGMVTVLDKPQATVYRWRNQALLAVAVALMGEKILLPPAAR